MPVHGSEQVAYSQDRVGTAEPAFSRRGRRGIGWWRWRLGCVVIGVIASIDELMDLDFDVDDLDVGERAVLAIGARKSPTQPRPDGWRVFLDPAGHPFCLVLA